MSTMSRHASQNVSRNLFNDEPSNKEANIDNSVNKLQEEMKKDREKMLRLYNFDISTDSPVEGSYQWTEGGRYDCIGIRKEPGEEVEKNHEDNKSDAPNAGTPQNSIDGEASTPKKSNTVTERPERSKEVKKNLQM